MKSPQPKAKGRIHPSPPWSGPSDAQAVLKLLPAAIAAVTAALGAEDREVLAYLVARSLLGRGRRSHHRPLFCCGCFDCYTSYWLRWDSSPDRELIHQAIEAFEEQLAGDERRRDRLGRRGGGRRDRSKKGKSEARKEGTSVEKVGDRGDTAAAAAAEALVEQVGAGDDAAGEELAAVTVAVAVAAPEGGERNRGWADVTLFFNSRFWSFWTPGI
ncbi:unnamed protein product [Spirodela intermedia]|uniref:Uncharacterized protein n=1 Tax=Spirodela intermedia TaxID=51605 RepID=A0A7I8J2K8_SPIIN|nr:unnamed protein product [Spirodela intermedia]CAA6664053.1 unnamed protein product [Spirodela intermedia]